MFRITESADGERKLEWDGSVVGWPISFSWETATGVAKTLRSPGGLASRCSASFTLRMLGWLEIVA